MYAYAITREPLLTGLHVLFTVIAQKNVIRCRNNTNKSWFQLNTLNQKFEILQIKSFLHMYFCQGSKIIIKSNNFNVFDMNFQRQIFISCFKQIAWIILYDEGDLR